MAESTNVNEFVVNLGKFLKLSEDKAKIAQAKITLQLQEGVIFGNPVDTGTMRGGWVSSVGVPSSYVPPTLNDRAPAGSPGAAGAANMAKARGSILSELRAAPLGTPTYVCDNVWYSGKVNSTHPTKAGFVQAVITNVESQFRFGGGP